MLSLFKLENNDFVSHSNFKNINICYDNFYCIIYILHLVFLDDGDDLGF